MLQFIRLHYVLRAKRAKILFSIVKYVNLCFCCRRRRGCQEFPIETCDG